MLEFGVKQIVQELTLPVHSSIEALNSRIDQGYEKEIKALYKKVVDLETAVYRKPGKERRFEQIEDELGKLKAKQATDDSCLKSEFAALVSRLDNQVFSINQQLGKIDSFQRIMNQTTDWMTSQE